MRPPSGSTSRGSPAPGCQARTMAGAPVPRLPSRNPGSRVCASARRWPHASGTPRRTRRRCTGCASSPGGAGSRCRPCRTRRGCCRTATRPASSPTSSSTSGRRSRAAHERPDPFSLRCDAAAESASCHALRSGPWPSVPYVLVRARAPAKIPAGAVDDNGCQPAEKADCAAFWCESGPCMFNRLPATREARVPSGRANPTTRQGRPMTAMSGWLR